MSRSDHHETRRRNSSPIQTIPMEMLRTQSWGRTVARKMAVNFMPSRHFSHYGGSKRKGDENVPFLDATLRNAENALQASERRAEMIAQEMEKNDNLMLDDPDAEQLRIEALRDMPQCLTVKRSVKARISASVSLKSKKKPIGNMKRLKYRLSFWSKKMRRNIHDFIFSIELWYEAIRTVEGHFGSSVATYFYFLRWLFLMGTFVSIFVMSFVLVPQVLFTNANRDNSSTEQSSNPIFMDFITGEGFFSNTTLFYGHYSPYVVSVIENLHYNIPYAYFFSMLLLYFAFFVILSIRMALSYRHSFIETGSNFSTFYANKIFCGWDFGIATTRAASLKSKTIYSELQELLSDSLKSKRVKSCNEIFVTILTQIFFHLLVMVMLMLVGVLMWILLDDSVNWVADFIIDIRNSAYRSIIIASIVSIVMVLGPYIFSHLSRYEDYYSPRTNLYVTLFRTFVLEAVVVFVLVLFWLRSNQSCWQTSLGQEIYRLVLFDFVLTIIVIPVLELFKLIIHRYMSKETEAPEFDIARNTLGLIYNQTLMWIGLFFSPLICAIVTVKLAILFYVKKVSVMHSCQPAGRAWRAAQTQTVFLMLVFISQLFIILTLGYILSSKSSRGCGPFQEQDYIYLILVNGISQLANGNIFFTIVSIITKPGVVTFILIFICIIVYYLRARAIAQKSMVGILREMLILEAKDKEFLLNAISKVTEGEWEYNLKEDTDQSDYNLETSQEWDFLNDISYKKPSNAGYKFVESPKQGFNWNQPSTSEDLSNWNVGKKYYAEDFQ